MRMRTFRCCIARSSCFRVSAADADEPACLRAYACLCARSVYVLMALVQSRGDWSQFWMGERARMTAAKKKE